MTIERPSENIGMIQSLRGIAAMMVVVFHLHVQMERLGLASFPVTWLQSGVDIFFVISGFIMWTTTAHKPTKGAAEFLRDRLIRIVPLYWAVTTFLVVVLLFAPQLTQSAELDVYNILMSFVFLPAPNSAFGGAYLPVLVPGWTLNFEMFFYVIFAGGIWLCGTNLTARAVLTVGILMCVGVLGLARQPGGALGFYFNDIVFEFAFGLLIGHLYTSNPALRSSARSSAFLFLILAGFLLIALTELAAGALPRSLLFGVPAAMIVSGTVLSPPLRLSWLERMGDWSYSLYLTHPIILSAVCQVWRASQPWLPVTLFPVAALLICLLAAALIFGGFERPLTKLLKTLGRGRTRTDRKIAAELP